MQGTSVREHLHAVLMAGGSGTRFWPASRAARPKQLIRLSGMRTLIQETYDRIRPLVDPERILVVTGKFHAKAVGQQLPELPRENLLIEPVGRNTAACAGFAALTVVERDPEALVALFPSDHVIKRAKDWADLVHQGARLAAAHDAVVTFGLEPTRPETGFGYIRVGDALDDQSAPTARRVAEFVEKPNLEKAIGFLASRQYLWNSGVFVASARKLLALIREHAPAVATGLDRIAGALPAKRARLVDRVYPEIPSVSLDGGVMEKAGNLLVIPAQVGWSDVGSWSALHEVLPADERGNVTLGSAIAVDSSGCVLYSAGATIAALGLRDLIVVQTPDAILVCPKDRAQEVRQIVDRLRSEKKDNLL